MDSINLTNLVVFVRRQNDPDNTPLGITDFQSLPALVDEVRENWYSGEERVKSALWQFVEGGVEIVLLGDDDG